MSKSFPKQALVFTCLQYKSFENTVGNGEIARNEQILLFPQSFPQFLANYVTFSLNLKFLSANSSQVYFQCCLLQFVSGGSELKDKYLSEIFFLEINASKLGLDLVLNIKKHSKTLKTLPLCFNVFQIL